MTRLASNKNHEIHFHDLEIGTPLKQFISDTFGAHPTAAPAEWVTQCMRNLNKSHSIACQWVLPQSETCNYRATEDDGKTVLGTELKVEYFGGFLEWEMEHSSFLQGQRNSDCLFP